MPGAPKVSWLGGFSTLLALFTAFAPIGAAAEDLPAARGCGSIINPTQRLACYDAAFAITPPSPVALFGDNEHLQKPRKAVVDLPKQVDAVITHATSLGQGLYQLTLDNGQVWATRQGDWSLGFAANDRVTIIRMPLGGYQISKPGIARSVTVRRVL